MKPGPERLIYGLAIVLVVGAVILGAGAVIFSDSYKVGQYVHDIALLVLGLGVVGLTTTRGITIVRNGRDRDDQ